MAKNKFDELPEDWKENLESKSDEEVRLTIATVAMAEAENQDAKEQDLDLAEKVEAAKFAGEQYKEATKANKLKIKYCVQLLESRGKA